MQPILWLALTVAIAVALTRVPWTRTVAELGDVQWRWLGAAILANFAILPLWAAEWRLLVPGGVRIAMRTMFGIVAVTASVLNSVPFLAGEASAVGLLISRAKLSRGAALSVLAMDQLFVAFAKLAVLGLAVALAPLPGWVRAGATGLLAALGASLVLLVPLAHSWSTIRARLLERRSRAREALAALVAWGAHLELLRAPARLAPVALLALSKKCAELLAIVAVQLAFGLEPSFAAGVLVLAALALSTLLPVAPANLGVYEATVFAIYRVFGVPAETALGLALLQHLSFLLPSLATGYLVLTARQWRRGTG